MWSWGLYILKTLYLWDESKICTVTQCTWKFLFYLAGEFNKFWICVQLQPFPSISSTLLQFINDQRIGIFSGWRRVLKLIRVLCVWCFQCDTSTPLHYAKKKRPLFLPRPRSEGLALTIRHPFLFLFLLFLLLLDFKRWHKAKTSATWKLDGVGPVDNRPSTD